MNFQQHTATVLSQCMHTFSETVIYYPKKGEPYPIKGIVDMHYQEIDTETQLTVQSTQPKVGIKVSSLKKSHHPQDHLDVRGKRYHIIEYQGDGQGGAELYLHEVINTTH